MVDNKSPKRPHGMVGLHDLLWVLKTEYFLGDYNHTLFGFAFQSLITLHRMQQRANIMQLLHKYSIGEMFPEIISSLYNIETQVKRHFILGWKDEEEIVSNKSPKQLHGMVGLYDSCGC